MFVDMKHFSRVLMSATNVQSLIVPQFKDDCSQNQNIFPEFKCCLSVQQNISLG